MTNLDDVPTKYKDQALRVLLHYMPMEMRGILMTEVPMAYNALCGREVVAVIRMCDLVEKGEVNILSKPAEPRTGLHYQGV